MLVIESTGRDTLPLFIDVLARIFVCIHTHLHPTLDCHNFGWLMHWLVDALAACIALYAL